MYLQHPRWADTDLYRNTYESRAHAHTPTHALQHAMPARSTWACPSLRFGVCRPGKTVSPQRVTEATHHQYGPVGNRGHTPRHGAKKGEICRGIGGTRHGNISDHLYRDRGWQASWRDAAGGIRGGRQDLGRWFRQERNSKYNKGQTSLQRKAKGQATSAPVPQGSYQRSRLSTNQKRTNALAHKQSRSFQSLHKNVQPKYIHQTTSFEHTRPQTKIEDHIGALHQGPHTLRCQMQEQHVGVVARQSRA